MRTLVTADLHLDDQPLNRYRHDFVRRLPEIARRFQIDQVMILGDLTEVKDRHGARLTNEVADYTAALRHQCPVIITQGNHDAIDPDRPFFQFLRWMEGVSWIKKPLLMKNGWLVLPHANSADEWKLTDAQRKCSAIFAHATFTGAHANGVTLKGIPPSALPRCSIFAGDIHTPQKFENVTYVGAPYTVDFGDDYVPRMLLISDTGKVTAIKCSGPQKRLVEYEVPDDRMIEVDWQTACARKAVQKGDIVKIKAHLPIDMITQWWKIRDTLLEWAGNIGVHVHVVQPVVILPERDAAAYDKAESHAPKNDEQIMHEYGQRVGLDKPTMRTGLKLMEQNE